MLRCLALWFFLIVLLSTPACSPGPKQVKVTGQLLDKGQPYIVKHNGSFSVRFIPVVEAGQHYDTYIADVKREDGTFVVNGRTGQGIPVGKYRISINQRVMNAPAEINEMNERFNPQDSKIIRDISDEKPLVIDLAKPSGD